MKLWDKGTSVNSIIENFTVGKDREMDLYLAKFDVLGSIAHAKMLTTINLLTKAEFAELQSELVHIYQIIENGQTITMRLSSGITLSATLTPAQDSSGNDLPATMVGSSGGDNLTGGTAADTISGGEGADSVASGAGDDSVDGGTGDDSIDGGDGNDTLDGGAGNDKLDGGAGNDSINGGSGNDTIIAGSGNDTVDGGTGTDVLDISRLDQAVVKPGTTPGSGVVEYIGPDGKPSTIIYTNIEQIVDNGRAVVNITAMSTDTGTAGDFSGTDNTLTYSGTITEKAGTVISGEAQVKLELFDANNHLVATAFAPITGSTGNYSWVWPYETNQNVGDYTLKATVVDQAGIRFTTDPVAVGDDPGEDQQAIEVLATDAPPVISDTQSPTIAITSNQASLATGQTATITFTLSEASSDFVRSDINVSGGTLGALTTTDNITYTATFTPAANSTTAAVISVSAGKFTDASGAVNLDTHSDSADSVVGHVVESDNQVSLTVNTTTAAAPLNLTSDSATVPTIT